MEKPPSRRALTAVGTAVAAVLGLLFSVVGFAPGSAAAATAGLHVANGHLYEADGSRFVMRGVNHAYAWYPGQVTAIADIATTGANTVRVVLSDGDRWTRTGGAEITALIDRCKAAKVICVLEVHDTTGYGEDAAAGTLDRAAQFWVDNKNLLIGQESYVVVNIANEPWGNSGYAAWTAATKGAIAKVRAAGLHHALMVDGPNWGQDWSGTMRDNAASVFAADPDRNTLFSVHMYGVYNTAAKVQDYLNAYTSAGLPVVVGEFGAQHSDGDPDEDAVMATAQAQGLGYLGWSWSGNGGGVEYLDLVNNFDKNAPTAWGNRLFHGANGIAATARTATVYGGGTPVPAPSKAPNGYPYCVSAASDPDGDGWGWENSASCVVRGGRADTGSAATTAPNGYPYCVSAASDPDGDGWGWENSASCVVRGGRADH
ncbi:cellulase family glycosylhydrolase [Kitasatospora sp. NPDC088134]|uniref:cellulase family glycosylhydrolase n=1 Tax=Kitasatospora sp. NPDC088134 TaxID=3364071 RepID=UPI00382C091D